MKAWVWTLPVVVALAAPPIEGAEKVIIDTDPGVDDAIAVIFAFHSPELEILGLTTIFGNVETELATENALRLVEMSARDVPVAEGAVEPLYMEKLPPPDFVHGKDGFGNVNLPPPTTSAIDRSAAEFIVDTVRAHPGEVTLSVLGPMTNIALALALEPDLPRLVKAVVPMGGVLEVMGNVSPVASANILGDPHAADIVLGTDWDVTLVPGDTTRQVRITDALLARLREHGGGHGAFLYDISLFYRDYYKTVGATDGFYAHDPTAMAFIVDPSLFTTEARAIRVVTHGMAIGEVIAATERHSSQPGPWHGIPQAEITTDVDGQGVLDLIERTITSR
jgi:inosine-uridine nucleoside N-ribohydrolase